jgi:hypothetical protein
MPPQCSYRVRAASSARRAGQSWYLVAEEYRMVNPSTQLFMAQRMGARIRSEKVDHTPLVTAPETVAELILEVVASAAA